ncbi:MAG: DUF2851 family protein [Chloroflexia bacterium]|nr:DUF2851 family protein [Chloroflexia bacterium]
MANAPDPPEIALSAAWHGQQFRSPLRTTDGVSIEIIHRGVWSNGLGPDFQDALLLFDGRDLRSGSVEIHLRTNHWRQHRHHLDPRYESVELHVVLRHDGSETRRHDGRIVPVLEIGPYLTAPLPAGPAANADWTRFGNGICAEALAVRDPGAIRSTLWRLGDRRLAAKAARLEAQLTAMPPAEVLYRAMCDGLGFTANRVPMRDLAQRLPIATLEALLATIPPQRRLALAQALIYGVAGFFPMSPTDATLAGLDPAALQGIESFWQSHGQAWHDSRLAPTAWARVRVRPANHPIARLTTLAHWVSTPPAAFQAFVLDTLRAELGPVTMLQRTGATPGSPSLGVARATEIVANAIIPFALALSEQTGDFSLAEAASRAWEALPPGESNAVTRRARAQVAGQARLGCLGTRGQQGLIHLDATLCQPRRCFECPIAHQVLATADDATAG